MLLLVYNFFLLARSTWHQPAHFLLCRYGVPVPALQPDNFTIGFLVSLAGTFITGIMVVWNNSMTSKVVHILSLMITISFIQEGRWRSLIYSCLSVAKIFFAMPVRILLRQREKVRKTAEAPCTFQNPPHEPYSALHCIHLLCDLQLRQPGLPPACFKFHRPALGARRRIVHSISLTRILFILLGSFLLGRRHLQA